jgi:hypothetical protein
VDLGGFEPPTSSVRLINNYCTLFIYPIYGGSMSIIPSHIGVILSIVYNISISFVSICTICAQFFGISGVYHVKVLS